MANVSSFLSRISASQRAFGRARAVYAAEVSPDFHVLGLFQPNEMALSRILAWMLDPSESHCQGNVFFELFLETLVIPLGTGRVVKVVLEEAVAEGRLDISVQLSDGRKIVIENKPFAVDQPLQLQRYLDHVDGAGHVIYLPPLPRQPSPESISDLERRRNLKNGRLIESSWLDLTVFFEKCRDRSKSPRLRFFIDEIPRYIRDEFQGVTDVTETANVIDQIVDTPDTIATAFLVSNAMDGVKERLIIKLNTDIQNGLSKGWALEGELSATKAAFLYIRYPELRVQFYLGFDNRNYADFSFGLQWIPRVREPSRNAVSAALAAAGVEVGLNLASDRKYVLWSWGQEADIIGLPRAWALHSQPWKLIADGSAALRVLAAAQSYGKIAKKLDALL